MSLKIYKKFYPPLVGGISDTCVTSYGAFWVRYRVDDSRGVTREFYRPFLAVDRDPTESPPLIGEPGLEDVRIDVAS